MTVSIANTAIAEVVDPSKNADLSLRLNGTEWLTWLLIDEATLRLMYADSEAYRETIRVLKEAQEELELRTNEVNFLSNKKFELERENLGLRRSNFYLEHPPWYKQPIVWGSAGIAAGVCIVLVSLAVGGAL